MGVLKACLLFTLICLAAADDNKSNNGLVPPGPPIPSTEGPVTSTVSTTSSTTSSTTPQPPITTTSSTTSTTKATTTSSTPKPTTTSSTAKPTTTSSTAKPTTTSSTPKPTTSSPTPKPTTPTPVDPIGKWSVNYTNTNRTCLLLQAELDIDINYKVGNATKNVTVQIPSNAGATGLCGSQTENVTLAFGITNTVNFNFKKSNDTKKYDLESVIVTLNVTLPGEKDWRYFVLVHAKDEFSTPVSNSYKCAKEQKLNLTAQGTETDYDGAVRVSHFQVQAFRNASSTKFDEALDCATSETPDVVPIAVGCALAALIIIVLIAYLIGRRRSQARGYLSMFAQNKREEDYIPMKNLSCFN